MARSFRKGPFIAYHLLQKIEEMNKTGKKTMIKTWSRSSMIIPSMIGHTIGVYNRSESTRLNSSHPQLSRMPSSA